MATVCTIALRVFVIALGVVGVYSCKSESQEPISAANTIKLVDVNETISDAGALSVLLDQSAGATLTFELVDGNAKVVVQQCAILDNSTYGYPDALLRGNVISKTGKWRTTDGVLGSQVGSVGQFAGTGERYLGFRFKNTENDYHYGWVQLACKGDNSELKIRRYAFDTQADKPIRAGQTDSNAFDTDASPVPVVGLGDILGKYQSEQYPDAPPCLIVIEASTDPTFHFTVQFLPFMWPWPKIPGHIVDGKLSVPRFEYQGNIPSPGGADRLYWATFSGTGEMFLKNGKTSILWDIHYDKTGFMPEQYRGAFQMDICN